MRAVTYTETGPSSVLSLTERPVPEPGPGEVRVRVVRAGVNPTDWKFRAVMMTGYDEVTPGQDGAGVVDALGEDVSGLSVGDRVWLILAQHGTAWGSAAEYTVQPAWHVARLPAAASYDLGAGLGVPAVTAHRALTCVEGGPSRLAPAAMDGMTVLVAGGAGAVGNAAIQLARWAGATVVTTVSGDEKAALASAAGAHHVVNYRTQDVRAEVLAIAPDGVDLVVEVAPAQNNDLDVEVTRNRGTIAIYANNGGESFEVAIRPTYSKNLRYQFVLLYGLGQDLVEAAAVDVGSAVAAGALRIGADAGVPVHHYDLADTAAAHDAVEAGAVGKVLLDVGEA